MPVAPALLASPSTPKTKGNYIAPQSPSSTESIIAGNTINQSDAHTVALPRTTKSAINHMLKLMEQNVISGQPLHIAVMHADAPDEAIRLRNRISAQFDCTELFITEFTPVMGVHTGPGLIGVAFYSGD